MTQFEIELTKLRDIITKIGVLAETQDGEAVKAILSEPIVGKVVKKTEHKIDKLDGKIDTMIDKLDEKYASKWVESAMSKLIATVCLAVLGALLALVIINK